MTIKDLLLQKCIEFVSQKIKTIEHSILELRLAASSETKSSVGDKYETGRAMIQLAIINCLAGLNGQTPPNLLKA